MLRSIKRPREEISANAPRLIQIQINPEKIGLIIGPGGKTIRRLQEETGAKIDIDDGGVVTLSSLEAAGAEAARDKIVAMTEGVQLGRIYEGRVTSIKEFGAFVEILPGKDGLVHISELSDGYVSSVTDVCRVGDPMLVKAIAIDDQDRVKLSRKAALAERGQPDELASRTRPPGAGGGGERRRAAAARRRPGVPADLPAAIATGAATAAAIGIGGGPADPRGPELSIGRPGRFCASVSPSPSVDRPSLVRRPATVEISHGEPPASSRKSRSAEDSIASEGDDAAPGAASARGGRPAEAAEAVEEPEVTRRLRAQYAEISQLAGGLAHEIRNPLSTLQLNLDLLAEDFQNPETPRDRRVLAAHRAAPPRGPSASRHPRELPPLRPRPGPQARAVRPERRSSRSSATSTSRMPRPSRS